MRGAVRGARALCRARDRATRFTPVAHRLCMARSGCKGPFPRAPASWHNTPFAERRPENHNDGQNTQRTPRRPRNRLPHFGGGPRPSRPEGSRSLDREPDRAPARRLSDPRRALGPARYHPARRDGGRPDPRPQGAVSAHVESGPALWRPVQRGPRSGARRPAPVPRRGLSARRRPRRAQAAAHSRALARAGPLRVEAQHSSPLRPRQRLLHAVARSPGAAIHLRLLRGSRDDDRAGAAGQDAPRLPQAPAQGRRDRRRGR